MRRALPDRLGVGRADSYSRCIIVFFEDGQSSQPVLVSCPSFIVLGGRTYTHVRQSFVAGSPLLPLLLYFYEVYILYTYIHASQQKRVPSVKLVVRLLAFFFSRQVRNGACRCISRAGFAHEQT